MFPGLGGMDPRKMKMMMRQLGIKSEDLAANSVIFELEGSRLVIENPQVTVIDMGGQKTYTVVGKAREEKTAGESGEAAESGTGEEGIPESDVEMVAGQAKVSAKKARKALEETGGDIAEAIEKLSGK
ncbi:MAG TPA: nascent polypeptide-associated complex protein [Candidatus Diapherotrites archaeon]|uniref:Nascent polypeptide-associated complex protein n=1 Tax=Candidatus Iainarchaeum sp. TaxID=3101447 RepID=A0A7J4J1S2_9ARCH|nr:nascent polypeptide-associated complex protein [Candidatus Diapherotrites archaeon]